VEADAGWSGGDEAGLGAGGGGCREAIGDACREFDGTRQGLRRKGDDEATTPAMRVSTGVSPAERGRRRKGGMELFSLFVDRSESPLLIRESAMDGSEAAHEGDADGVPDVFFGFGPRRVRLEAEAGRVDGLGKSVRRSGRRKRSLQRRSVALAGLSRMSARTRTIRARAELRRLRAFEPKESAPPAKTVKMARTIRSSIREYPLLRASNSQRKRGLRPCARTSWRQGRRRFRHPL
jgi:hypothetical protein